MKKSKGLIALDLDGTTTARHSGIENEVLDYLEQLQGDGWDFLFVTGRTYLRAIGALRDFNFQYYLAPQNGAFVIEMSKKEIIQKNYLSWDLVEEVREYSVAKNIHFIVYGGIEEEDRCLYCRQSFSKSMQEYFDWRQEKSRENWCAVNQLSFEHLKHPVSLKWFGEMELLRDLSNVLKEKWDLHAPVISDPFNRDYALLQATHPSANKGFAAQFLANRLKSARLIAAGDDHNDVSMLQKADIAIVMNTAPQSIQDIAHIIAPSAKENGIIKGLSQALKS